MTRQELLARVQVDPNICFGRPCIRGTRIWVSLILDWLAAGQSHEQILADYPTLKKEDIYAAIAFGADLSRGRYLEFPAA